MELLRDPIGWFKRTCKRLTTLKDSPHAIALGVAIGIFFGFLPLWGLKTLASLGCACLLRASPVAAVIVVNLRDLLLPLMPFLMVWEYQVGARILGLPPDATNHLKHLSFHELFQWTTFLNIGEPVFLGALLVAPPLALITYLVTLPLANAWHRKSAAASAETKETSSADSPK